MKFNPALQFWFAEKLVVVWSEGHLWVRVHNRAPVCGGPLAIAEYICESLTGWGKAHPDYMALVHAIERLA